MKPVCSDAHMNDLYVYNMVHNDMGGILTLLILINKETFIHAHIHTHPHFESVEGEAPSLTPSSNITAHTELLIDTIFNSLLYSLLGFISAFSTLFFLKHIFAFYTK